MEDLTKIVSELEYDFEKDLHNRGFIVDFEKEEHITYQKNGLYIRIVYDAPYTDEYGVPDLMRIYVLDGLTGGNYYLGKKPISSKHLDNLFKNIYLEEYIN